MKCSVEEFNKLIHDVNPHNEGEGYKGTIHITLWQGGLCFYFLNFHLAKQTGMKRSALYDICFYHLKQHCLRVKQIIVQLQSAQYEKIRWLFLNVDFKFTQWCSKNEFFILIYVHFHVSLTKNYSYSCKWYLLQTEYYYDMDVTAVRSAAGKAMALMEARFIQSTMMNVIIQDFTNTVA